MGKELISRFVLDNFPDFLCFSYQLSLLSCPSVTQFHWNISLMLLTLSADQLIFCIALWKKLLNAFSENGPYRHQYSNGPMVHLVASSNQVPGCTPTVLRSFCWFTKSAGDQAVVQWSVLSQYFVVIMLHERVSHSIGGNQSCFSSLSSLFQSSAFVFLLFVSSAPNSL